MKTCSKCKNIKAFIDFPRNKNFKDGWNGTCKACLKSYAILHKDETKARNKKHRELNKEKIKERNRLKHKNNPIIYKNYKLKHRYGINLNTYQEMLKIQQNRCKICNLETKLVVDHCHTTGKIRGLLCKGCNTSLGSFKDSIQNLKNAITYLEVSIGN